MEASINRGTNGLAVKTFPNWKALIVGVFLTQVASSFSIGTFHLYVVAMKETLNISSTAVGFVSSTYGLVFAASALVWGFVVDRIGARKTMSAGVFLAGLSLIGYGLLSYSYAMTVIMWGMVAFSFGALYNAVITKVTASWFHPTKRGFALSCTLSGGLAFSSILGIVCPILLVKVGWHMSYVIFGIMCLFFSFFCWAFIRDTPGELGQVPYGSPAGTPVKKTSGTEGGPVVDKAERRRVILSIFKRKITWHLGAIYIAKELGKMGVVTFMVAAVKMAGYSNTIAGLVATAYVLGALVFMLIMGPISDRFKQRKYGLMLLYAISIVGMFGYLIAIKWGAFWVFACTALIGVCIAASVVLFPIFAENYEDEVRGAAVGSISALSLVGAYLGPIIAGYIADKTGNMMNMFYFTGGCSILSLILSWMLPNSQENE